MKSYLKRIETKSEWINPAAFRIFKAVGSLLMVLHFFAAMLYFIATRFPHQYDGFLYPDEPRTYHGYLYFLEYDEPYTLYPSGLRLSQYVSALYFTTSYLSGYNSHIPQDSSQVYKFLKCEVNVFCS